MKVMNLVIKKGRKKEEEEKEEEEEEGEKRNAMQKAHTCDSLCCHSSDEC